MKTYLIVGKKFSGLSEYILSQGHDYLLLRDKIGAKNPEKKLKRRILVDFSNIKEIIHTVRKLDMEFAGVISTYENYILPTAIIAQNIGLPGIPINSAEACTDKELMRQLFSKAESTISPSFNVVKSEHDLIDFTNQHGFPVILKPANLAKSILVTKSNNISELLEQYRFATNNIQAIYKKYAPDRQPKLIIEEFLEGSIHSVDAFIDTRGTITVLDQIVDYQSGHDIGYDDNFHYSRTLPSKLSDDDQTSLKECAEMGIRALKMKSSAAHVEVIMTKDGPRIVEIGARNGGYRERMHRLANNIDIPAATLSISEGGNVDIRATKNEPCAVLELFPMNKGVFKSVKNLDILEKLESIKYIKTKYQPGETIGKSSQGYKAVLIIIIHNSNLDQFNKDLAYINDNVEILIK
ncbi:ATP-grasp domain-containing protein [Candidatus Saccharibacteria bacterium]|nr:ATP-grasp domain-containing protein [Candidatus Saccharibacteria bacterium]